MKQNNTLKENYPQTVFKIGSPLFEVLKYYKDDIQKSTILTKLKVSKKNYFLMNIQRRQDKKKLYDY